MNWIKLIIYAFAAIITGIIARAAVEFWHKEVNLQPIEAPFTEFKSDQNTIDSLVRIINHKEIIIAALIAERDTVFIKVKRTISLPITKESKKEAIQWAIDHVTK